MELHHANARLKDEQVEVVVGSQALDKVQRAVAHALNLNHAQVSNFQTELFNLTSWGICVQLWTFFT